ncbi:MAG: DNA recombination protein RmuC [Phycisphaerae bacterium]|nr:DNA recombination protein RmuC [Phycisphaerae bacterium]
MILNILITIIILLLLGLLILVAVMMLSLSASRREAAQQNAVIKTVQENLDGLRKNQESLSQMLEKNLRTGQENISSFLTTSQKTFGELKEQIGKLKSDSERMLQLGADVRSLQNILKAPKLRGQMGEYSLAALLKQILPGDSFVLQHGFANGKIVDALIKLPDFSVSVDAKFPLPAFEQMNAAADDGEKAKLRRTFQNDVCRHIDKIAESYILPAEGTMDFALMYIPAENVYYETIVKYDNDRMDLLNYALEKKVIPVSPNLLYAYLMTIVMGLHGLQIEKEAAMIRKNLQKLSMGLEAFTSNWEVLGKHIRNAQGQYDEGQNKLGKFLMQLEQIQQEENG